AKAGSEEIRAILSVYDTAYANLVERHEPKLFRDFLLGAPQLFLDIGDRMGAISHISGFWNHGFPMGAPRTVSVEELIAIFRDFNASLSRNSNVQDYGDSAMMLETAAAPRTMIQDGSPANTKSAKLTAASAAARQLVMALLQSGE